MVNYTACLWGPLFRDCASGACAEQKGAGAEAAVFSPSPMTLEGERDNFPQGWFFSMKKIQSESFVHTQERVGVFFIDILFGNLSVFFFSGSNWHYIYSVEWRILYLWAVSSLSKA